MGLIRDLTFGVTRAALEALQKAADPDAEDKPSGPPPGAKDASGGDSGPPGGDSDGPPGPPEPPPPARQTPEPTMGSGPTLAAPAEADGARAPQNLPHLERAAGEPKALQWDPFAIVDTLGYKDRPSALTYQTLNAMVWQMPIIQAIIQTRVKQVSAFAEVQQDKYNVGFRVQLRDRKADPSPATERLSQQLERWLLTTGTTDYPGTRDSFGTFLEKVTRDSLTYDACCWEIVPSRGGAPAEFYAVDAQTIRIADTTKLFLDPEDMEVTRYVQIYDGLVLAEWPAKEFCYGVRNPRTDIRLQQYGTSELEMLVTTITALLWAFEYNKRYFSQGSSAKGIINFKGAVPESQLRNFRRHWYSMVSGVENAWKTPIVNSEDLQWVSMQQSNKDMEYNAWMDFLIKIAAGVYGMDPMEVNFKYGDTGQKSMFESANASKLSASKDKGLKPLLKFLELKINQSLIWQHDEDFEFKFVGLDAQSPAEQADLNTKLVKSIKTVNEARAEEDMAPLPNGLGDIILDPVFMQHLTMAQQQQQQQDAAFGGGGEGGGEGGLPEDGPPVGDGEEGDDDAGKGPDEDVEPDMSEENDAPPQSDAEAAAKPAGSKPPFGKSMTRTRTRSPLRKARGKVIVDVEV